MQEVTDFLYQVMIEDIRQLRAGVPGASQALHDGQLRYFRHHVGNMRIWTLAEVWQHGGGQCGDLAPAVAAERTEAGMLSYPVVYQSATPGVVHVVVQDHASGRWIDPSRSGGMAASTTSFLPDVGSL